ncbi:MAG: glycosyltransferase family 4 protein, partial [Candidatus Omnitrophota bacterium]
MKILVYCHEFPPVGGGAGNALYHLARCWVRDGGCDVTVVTSACAGLELSQKVDGITVNRLEVGRHLPWRATLWQMLRFMTASILTSGRFYRQARPDICVAFMTMPGGPGPRMIKKRFGVPYVCQIRGGDVPGFGSSFLNRIHGVASHFIVSTWNKSDFVIANGKGLAQLASKTRLRCPVKVLPNGVDSDF